MNEQLLHCIWQQQLFDHSCLQTTEGETIMVEKVGMANSNAGPDFLDAHIRIGNTLWVGNVEIHQKSSMWTVHKHHTQESYNSVILHVVAEHDKEAHTARGTKIPTLILPIGAEILDASKKLTKGHNKIMCCNELSTVDTFLQNMVFDRLVVERFERKSIHVLALLEQNGNSWEETCYQMVARSFGAPVNSTACEQLAQSVPLKILAKHRNSLTQLEALLFGQAGLLLGEIDDRFYKELQNEYNFLQKKYALIPMSGSEWKFSRMRPSNFPTLRIAQLAQLLFQSHSITSKILECRSIGELEQLFSVQLHGFWLNHYSFSHTSPTRKKSLGETTVHSIIINTIVPFLFAYGTYHSNDDIKQRALDFLETLPAERNAIITLWDDCSVQCKSSFRSQALLQLYNEYCAQRKCLQCAIGKKIISKQVFS
ncbi:MAG: DUF2851 family protein [Bacteroidales bacterium]|jgi:hypothetical protein|nr:DUF2851 family protein [Bacteroidales bacterium]